MQFTTKVLRICLGDFRISPVQSLHVKAEETRTSAVYETFVINRVTCIKLPSASETLVQGRIWGGGGFPGFRKPPPPPPLPYACTFSKRNKTKKQPLDPARGPMRPPGPPAEPPPPPPPPPPPMIDLVRPCLFMTVCFTQNFFCTLRLNVTSPQTFGFSFKLLE